VRLLVSDLEADSIAHARFKDLPRWLGPGDLLVVNTSATLNAALHAEGPAGEPFEVHLSTELPGGFWTVEVRRADATGASGPFLDAHAGTILRVEPEGALTLLAPYPMGGATAGRARLWLAALRFPAPVGAFLARHGFPVRYKYVTASWPTEAYQTVFAVEPGSAEMPSAGRPFTPELVTALVARGVSFTTILLHTGVSSLEEGELPYEEYYRVSSATADQVNAARRRGRHVVAVGTTVVRALETVTDERGTTFPGEGWTRLVIDDRHAVRSVTGLITGLHESRSTHLTMIERVIDAASPRHATSGAGRDHLTRTYGEARRAGYLWHEFGDSHLILGRRESGQ
jgi:S-adenosylmethionine:tRNA ribosyltransferase-isomerase